MLSRASYHTLLYSSSVRCYQSCTEFNGNVISPHHATVLFHADCAHEIDLPSFLCIYMFVCVCI